MPIFDLHLELNLAPKTWWAILKITVLNAIVVTVVVIAMHILGQISLASYSATHQRFFWPLEKFGQFFLESAFLSVVQEEILYRGPIWLLSALIIDFSGRKYRLDLWLFAIAILIPNYFWAIGHSPAVLPVFITGISLGWLVVKTRSLWPAIVAHSALNISIFFFLKLALYITSHPCSPKHENRQN